MRPAALRSAHFKMSPPGCASFYYVFDVLIVAGRDGMAEPLSARRELPGSRIVPSLSKPIRESVMQDAGLSDVIAAVKAHGLEGIVAKRLDSRYEPGQRSGAWKYWIVGFGLRPTHSGFWGKATRVTPCPAGRAGHSHHSYSEPSADPSRTSN